MDLQIGDSIKHGQDRRANIVRHIKQYALAALSVIFLTATWWSLNEALFNGHGGTFWAYPVAFMILSITSLSFYALSEPDHISFFTFNVIGLATFLGMMPRNAYILAGGLIFFFLSLWFQKRIGDEQINQLNFSYRRTLGNSQTVITYGFLILLGCMIYSNIRTDFVRDPQKFYQRVGETAVKGIPYLSSDKSKYNLGQSVENFYRQQAEDEFPQFNSVSREQQEILLAQIRQNFTNQFGVDADPNASLRAALTQVVTQRISETLGRFEKFFPLFFTVLIIGVLRTFAFVFNWAVLFISWVFFKILLVTRFFRIGKRTVEVEKLEI